MSIIFLYKPIISPTLPHFHPHLFPKYQLCPLLPLKPKTKTLTLKLCKSSQQQGSDLSGDSNGGDDEWVKKLPEKKKPLYAHSLPCIEAWLRQLGFYQSREDQAAWAVEKLDWHAQLNLDITDLYIRYLKSGPGNLEKDVERRFSYALSREDIENAILGGP